MLWSWVKKGWIRTTRRSGRYHQIRSKDLKRFLQNPPQRIKNRIAAIVEEEFRSQNSGVRINQSGIQTRD
ncbi:hypothetical protein COO91_08407 [Nostoc flagelliforme CCNUN1]|uniref:Uncharacterized protein n=1 Tax=Nostoc flagelliforme CCNUN1 TaxID=2038116 RepID=A0A2K8T3U7_9NOSO|nr:hypothetical protein COO91_08407 [Nostoc flagelliforme CCNUN1]